ncbi:MAG: glycosyltransferase [Lachnospiraceae bacterium]
MKIQVLLSAMFLENEAYADTLHITSDAVIINQCDRTYEETVKRRSTSGREQKITYIETTERGLSKSRNLAIAKAEAEVCILCDNDVEYVEDYEKLICDAFESRPDADIIVFYIKRKEKPAPNFPKEKRMGYLSVLKIFSPEIAFRRKSVSDVRFDEQFGAGAHYNMGEENIFLYDCLKKKKKIYYVPIQIASLREEPSTWFQGYDERFFVSRGANYGAMSRLGSLLLILQFALRKHGLYGANMTMSAALRLMLKGRKEYLGRVPRIFLAGDFRTGTGPANVTKSYLERFPNDTLYQKACSKVLRVPEIIMKTMRAEVVLYSGYSGQNVLGLRFAKLIKKPSAYLMHGCVEHENAINGVPDEAMNRIERKTLALADRIFAVSEWFAGWLREAYPEYRDKIDSAVNGVDFMTEPKLADEREPWQIISIGGGMPRKKIRYVCEALQLLNEGKAADGEAVRLLVIGDRGLDTELINSYPFVENLGMVSFEETKALLHSSRLFIQNSCFETFGLAPLEALMCGCSILLSKHVGALELFDNVEETDVIENYEDAGEIAEKIDSLLRHGNADRLMTKIDKESASWEARTCQLQKKLAQLR